MLTPYPWQERQWRRLLDAAARDRLPHALLLSGAEGLGVEAFVLALAGKLLCEGPDGDRACGECRACTLFRSGNHPDFVRVQPEETGKAIRVESIRDLIDYIHLSSQYSRYKIAVIDPAEAMNRHAANSLLKTLEEPPPHSVFILSSRRPTQLPVTIRSRCQLVNFADPETATARAWLAGQLQGDTERASELLAMAHNRPLTALELEEEGTRDKQSALLADLKQLQSGGPDPIEIARRWLDLEPVRVMQWLLVFIRIMGRRKLEDDKTGPDSHFRTTLDDLANGLDLLEIMKWYDIVLDNYRAATGPFHPNQQGLLEDIIVNWRDLSQATGRNRQ